MLGGQGYNFQGATEIAQKAPAVYVLHDVEENAHKKPMKRNSTVYFEKGLLSCLMIAV